MKGEGWSTEYVSGVGGVIIKRWEEGYRRIEAGGEGIIPTPRTKYVPRGTFCYYTIYNKVWIHPTRSIYTLYIGMDFFLVGWGYEF